MPLPSGSLPPSLTLPPPIKTTTKNDRLVCRKLFQAACKEGTAIDDYIRMLITYCEELIGLGQTLDDAEFAITLLTSLPESWNNFIAGIDTTSLGDSSKLIA